MNTVRILSLIGIGLLACAISVLNTIAYRYSLYWSLWWFDIGMHFLGGVLIGLLFVWIMQFLFSTHARALSLTNTLIVVLTVGIVWEVFEFVVGARVFEHTAYVIDTTLDLVMDLVGALGAYFLFRFLRSFRHSQNAV